MEDKENLNNDNLINSSMFGSDGDIGGEAGSMFASNQQDGIDSMFGSDTDMNSAENSMFASSEVNDAQNDSMFASSSPETDKVNDIKDETSVPNTETPTPKEEVVPDKSKDSIFEDLGEENKPETPQKEPIQVIADDSEDEEENIDNNPSGVVTVRPVKFKKFEATPPIRTIKKNLDILQDISMHVSVELGRAKLSIKEVMDFEQGSIVELNKIAGEQVEVFVNGKLVAKGEVIVIEDRFGVRVTSTNIAKNPVIP